MEILYGIVGVIAVAAVCIYLFLMQEGNAKIAVKAKERTPFVLEALEDDRMIIKCKVEFANQGKQCGTIMDCYVRHLLPYEHYDGVKVLSRAEREGAPREDDYFEATLIEKGQRIYVWVEITLIARRGNGIRDALTQMVDLPVDLVYQYVTRCPWAIGKQRIVITAQEIASLAGVTLAEQ